VVSARRRATTGSRRPHLRPRRGRVRHPSRVRIEVAPLPVVTRPRRLPPATLRHASGVRNTHEDSFETPSRQSPLLPRRSRRSRDERRRSVASQSGDCRHRTPNCQPPKAAFLRGAEWPQELIRSERGAGSGGHSFVLRFLTTSHRPRSGSAVFPLPDRASGDSVTCGTQRLCRLSP
jgi:hypothetical protein